MPGANDRGSWMTSKIFCIPLAQFLTTLFSRSPKFVTFFASIVKFHENSLLGCPPVLHHAPVTTFLTSFLVIYLHSFKKTGPLDAPQGGCPGPSHRPHHPLYATDHLEEHSFPKQLVIMFPCT